MSESEITVCRRAGVVREEDRRRQEKEKVDPC
jgi:hypothetical protein